VASGQGRVKRDRTFPFRGRQSRHCLPFFAMWIRPAYTFDLYQTPPQVRHVILLIGHSPESISKTGVTIPMPCDFVSAFRPQECYALASLIHSFHSLRG
jgi:hypothetical protein